MSNWELTVYLVILLLGLMPLVRYARDADRRMWGLIVVVVLACLAGIVFYGPVVEGDAKPLSLSQSGLKATRYLPRIIKQDGFVSSDQCRSCHPSHYSSWHDSYHRTMTQVATAKSVQAPFDDITLEATGLTCRLEQRGDEFWAEMPDMDVESALQDAGYDLYDPGVRVQIPNVWRRIVMTTGSHHLQGYWVASHRGRELFQFPFIYNLHEKQWVPVEDVFIRPPQGSRRLAVWNTNCIQCHALNGKPGLNDDVFNSSTTELGISCEACHGPGDDHIRKHQNPLARYQRRGSNELDDTIVNPARCSSQVSSQICGQCHSSFTARDYDDWAQNGLGFRAGGSLEEKRHMFHFTSERAREMNAELAAAAYWQDGTCRTGGREYMAMVESPCFKHEDPARQMSCLSCHSMHDSDPNDQLARNMEGNEACCQCHESYREQLETHTHHAASSSGSLCYNCHMPHSSYALLKAIRSHRVESPSVTTSSRTGKPNGCNQCHLDETLAWTAEHLSDWYGLKSEELNEKEKTVSAAILWLLRGDAAQRAIAAWTFGWEPARQVSGTEWMAPYLAQLLDDPYSAVRFIAFDSLRKADRFSDLTYDYVAPREKRFEVLKKVFLEWEQLSASRATNNATQLLINSDGSLNRDEFGEIFKQRDNKPIEFPE